MPQTRRQLADREQALTQLTRGAHIANRPGIVLLDPDLGALEALTGTRRGAISLIERLQEDGRLRRVRRGVYLLVEQDGTIRVSLLDLIAATAPRPYLVTAGRALEFHDLTDQHFRLAVVATATQVRGFTWRGDEVRFVRTSSDLGRRAVIRTRQTRARIATPERALIDGLAHPGWGVSLSQLAEALWLAGRRDGDFPDRLAVVAAGDASAATSRRFGFLVAHLFGPTSAKAFLPLRGEGKAAPLLHPAGPSTGRIDKVWRVRVNVDLDQLFSFRG
jgi:predicted transcriptional regulator of viral defense system